MTSNAPVPSLSGGESGEVPAPATGGSWVTSRPPKVTEILGRMFSLPVRMSRHRDLISISVKRDLEARFRGTILGWAWPLIHPLFLFVVYYFIFTKLLSFKIPNLPANQESALGVYMFCGILAWSTVSDTLSRSTGAILENGNLIKKLAFPAEILPLNLTLVGSVTHVFALVMLLLACTATPIWPAPGLHALWIPVILLAQVVFTFGLSMLLATLQVFLRDTLQFVTIFLTVWMFITPLFWVPELMGDSAEPYLGLIYANPVYSLVTAWRGALMGDVIIPADAAANLPNPVHAVSTAAIPEHLLVFSLWAVAFYVIGYAFFVLSERRFADEV